MAIFWFLPLSSSPDRASKLAPRGSMPQLPHLLQGEHVAHSQVCSGDHLKLTIKRWKKTFQSGKNSSGVFDFGPGIINLAPNHQMGVKFCGCASHQIVGERYAKRIT